MIAETEASVSQLGDTTARRHDRSSWKDSEVWLGREFAWQHAKEASAYVSRSRSKWRADRQQTPERTHPPHKDPPFDLENIMDVLANDCAARPGTPRSTALLRGKLKLYL